MIKIKSRLAVTTFAAVASVGLAFSSAAPVYAAYAQDTNQDSRRSFYSAELHPLNDSGVHGSAELKFRSGQMNDVLKVKLSADGVTPDQTHAVHIHGNDNPEVALCPTNEQDSNNDGFVSVVEGAAKYGPIKLSLTSPQTPFGAGPTPALFTPFAGTPGPDNAFPMADNSGSIFLKEKYVFDQSAAARGALATLKPLENQHIVVHGAYAPASVDADAFAALGAPVKGDMNAEVYDALLPVACGEISTVGNNSWNNDTEEQQTATTDEHKGYEENSQTEHHNQQASEQPQHVESHDAHDQNENDTEMHQNKDHAKAKDHSTKAKDYTTKASWNKHARNGNSNSYAWLTAKHQYN